MTLRSRLYGLNVASPYPLGHASSGDETDATISVADEPTTEDHAADPVGRLVASHLPVPRRQYALYARDDGTLLYRFHDYADIEISADLTRLHCQFVDDAPREVLSVILAGHVLATLLMLRGELVLHASAVERGGRAVAFVGNSGGGKSTLAAMTCLVGARLVTDDVLRVSADDDRFSCFRGARSLRLRPTSKALAQTLDGLDEQTADGRHLLTATPTDEDELPLDAIYLPRLVETGAALEARRLAPKEAMLALLQCPRVHNWVDAETAGAHFRKLAAVADALPIHELFVPWGVERDETFFAELTELVFSEELVAS